MKKLFTLVIALVAMTICAKAQTIFSEGFEGGTLPTGWTMIDSDGDGVNWRHSSEFLDPGVGHNSSYCMVSQSYDNTTGILYPDNWLITPAINLTGSSTLTFWVCGQDANYSAEHYGVYISTTNASSPSAFTLLGEWTVGQSRTQSPWEQKTVDLSNYTGTVYLAFRHFNTSDEFYLDLDDITVTANPTTPTISLAATTLDFNNVIIGSTSTKQVAVTGYNLTTDITATTAAPYSVSSNGTTFSTTATLAQNGGTLYVKYEPTAGGTDNGSVVLSSTSAPDATLTLTGAGLDCSNITLPIMETFDNLSECWQYYSADAANPNDFGPEEGVFAFNSYSSASDYTQYLITPMLPSTEPLLVSFDHYAFIGSETFMVGFSSTTDAPSAFTWSSNITSTATEATYNTTAPAGTKYIAIKYTSNYLYYLYIDNFSIRAVPTTPTFDIATTSLNFNNVAIGSSKTFSFPVEAYSLTDNITVSATAPFTVSSDNSTFGATATITATTGTSTITSGTVYVRYSPTAVGTNSDDITIASTGATSVDVAVSGTGVDCSQAVSTFPWTEDFSGDVFPPVCWDIENTSADTTWEAFDYSGMWASCLGTEYNRTEKLITKTLDFSNYTRTILMDLDFMSNYTYINDGTANFKIYASTDGGATFASTPLWQLSQFGEFTNWSPTTATINISSLAGQSNVKLAFVYEGTQVQVLFTNINLYTIEAEDIILSEESLSFSGIVGESYVKTVNVTAYNLPEDITVTTSAPFSVSADGTTFNTTTTLPAAGGTLYVKYTAQVGFQTGMVLFASDIDEETLPLLGTGVDCSTPASLPFTEGFESELTECWLNIDNDGDGYAWMDNSEYGLSTHDGEGCMISASYINGVGALYPENWLVTPALAIPAAGATLTYWVAAQDASYPAEYYEVLVSTNGTSFSNFSQIFNETLSTDEFEQRTLSLNAYAGQNINIAFVHKDVTDMYMMKIDDINVSSLNGVNDIENFANIYPNPANNILNINATSNINSVEVFNMMGQKVAAYDANDTYTQINTSNLINGMYLIRINTENGVINQKFTVAR